MSSATYSLNVVDIHVGGDVHRIVLDGLHPIPGATVLDKTRYLEQNADGLRKVLLDEPRGGHPALFADVVVPPSLPEAEAGFVIMENNGYPMFSGTNIMSTAIALVEAGHVDASDGERRLTLEAPGGMVDVFVNCQNGMVLSVTCRPSLPAFAYERGLSVDVPGRGCVAFDLYWAGEFFPVIDASSYGFNMSPNEEYDLGAFAKDFIDAAAPVFKPVHPEIEDRRDLASVIFTKRLQLGADGRMERPVVPYVYPNRQVGRCAAGMPSSIVLSQLIDDGLWDVNEPLRTRSPRGTTLEVQVSEQKSSGPYQGYVIGVTGRGWTIARSELIIDPRDPMTPKDDFLELVKSKRVEDPNTYEPGIA